MPWYRSRSQRRPGNWKAVRRRVFYRDGYECQIRDVGCVGFATEVDHIDASDDHGMANLRAVCSSCHRKKSRVEAREGYLRALARGKRPDEPHPGSV